MLFPGGTAQAQMRTSRNVLQLEGHTDPETVFLVAFAPGADPETMDTGQLAAVGVLGRVVTRLRLPDGSWQIAVQGMRRERILRFARTHPVLDAVHAPAEERPAPRDIANLLTLQILQLVEVLTRLDDAYTPELVRLLQSNIEDPGRFSDLVAMTVALDIQDRVAVLGSLSVEDRLRRVVDLLGEKVEVARIAREIQHKALGEISRTQREHFLRRQMQAIRAELGEQSREEADARGYETRAAAAGLPTEVGAAVATEIARLRLLSAASGEYAVVQQWLEWILSLPWNEESGDPPDLARVRAALDADHHGLERPKDRILEYLSVRALSPDAPSPVLCFAGPPGTGKTSLAQSIARSLGRKMVRISVGGVHDESQIRGHRRTYIGAMPGRIVQALRRAGTLNPVMVIDELDKMTSGPHGDPSAALLEVLDPEQNSSFTDHYLDVPVDLSRVMFVATANNIYEIPDPLLDRMEIVHLPGYTESEKLAIARRHLVPRARRKTGTGTRVRISPSALRTVIRNYTREAGVRDLTRRIEEVLRKYAVRLASGKKGPFRVGPAAIRTALGRPPARDGERRTRGEVGIVTGLAWTAAGGDVLVIEGLLMEGTGNFIVTGSLGDVMKESIQAASSWVRAQAGVLGIENDRFGSRDVHLHFPEGAVPKDGPSAGVAVVTVLVSLYTGRRIRHDIGMTGEITLRGRVLPIGGLREKVSAAYRAGLKEVLVPKSNLGDLEDVPPEVLRRVKVRGVETVHEVLKVALLRT